MEARTGAGRRVQAEWMRQIEGDQPEDWADRMAQAALDRQPRDRTAAEITVEEALAEALKGQFGTFMRTTDEEWRKAAQDTLARMGVRLFAAEFDTEKHQKAEGILLAIDPSERVPFTVVRGEGTDGE